MKTVVAALLTIPLLAGVSPTTAAERSSDAVHATGTLEPRELASVTGPPAGGRVKTLGADSQNKSKRIDYGSHVKKNDVLAQLDTTTATAVADRAKANLRCSIANYEVAKAHLAFAHNLQERGKVEPNPTNLADPAASIDIATAKARAADAAVEASKADLRIAEIAIEQSTIISPIDGVVIDRRIDVGQPTSPNQSLFLIAGDQDKFQVWASVAEADIARVAVGQPARFSVEALPDKVFTGRVSQIRLNAQMANNAVHFTVVIDADDAKGLLPYLTANVEIDTTKPK